LNAKTISTTDRGAYAVACSLTEFLAEREGRDKLMPFGEAVQQRGLQAALNSSFGFRNLDDLQKEWQSWYSARNSFASNSNTQQKAP
jgi:hypothetical protein